MTSVSKFQPNYAQAFDLLATLVAVVRTDGVVVFANAALEDVMGVSRRTIEGSALAGYFSETQSFQNALQGAQTNAFATMRYDAHLRRPLQDPMPVHVIVAPTDVAGEVLVELLPLEQQTRQDREERLIDQAQANKELIRNLAHEIKNPLGGIRGAAQLLQIPHDRHVAHARAERAARAAGELAELGDLLLLGVVDLVGGVEVVIEVDAGNGLLRALGGLAGEIADVADGCVYDVVVA
mgnify:CR=1 FL=1